MTVGGGRWTRLEDVHAMWRPLLRFSVPGNGASLWTALKLAWEATVFMANFRRAGWIAKKRKAVPAWRGLCGLTGSRWDDGLVSVMRFSRTVRKSDIC